MIQAWLQHYRAVLPQLHRRASFAAICGLASAGTACAQPCNIALSAQLPLRQSDSLIEARINGQPVLLELDTGAFSTILTPEAAKRLELRPDPDQSEKIRGNPDDPMTISGLGGYRLGQVVMARDFQLGSLHGHKFRFVTSELGTQSGDGLLSIDFLKDFDLDLDLIGRHVRIFTAYGSCDRPKVFLQPPVYTVKLIQDDEDPKPRVLVTIDGQRFVAEVDTGAEVTMIYRSAAARLRLGAAELAADRRGTMRGIGSKEVESVRHVFTSFTIGDLTIKNMPLFIVNDVQQTQTEILLGADFQRRLHLWISNSSHALVIQYPPQASPPVP